MTREYRKRDSEISNLKNEYNELRDQYEISKIKDMVTWISIRDRNSSMDKYSIQTKEIKKEMRRILATITYRKKQAKR